MRNESTPKNYEYDIQVLRTGYSQRDIKVIASSFEEAKRKAIDTAGDYEFVEYSSDYTVINAERKIEPLEAKNA